MIMKTKDTTKDIEFKLIIIKLIRALDAKSFLFLSMIVVQLAIPQLPTTLYHTEICSLTNASPRYNLP